MATNTPTHDAHTLRGKLGHALEALEQTTGVQGRVIEIEPTLANTHRADALVDIYVDKKAHRYVVEAKTRVDRLTALGHVKAQLAHMGERGLLFAPYITPTMAEQCRQLDLAFLDTAGNAYLRAPGLHLFITGKKPQDMATTKGTRGGGTATALRVVFTLLCEPGLLNAPYREIVEAANVALGAIGWVFLDLAERGYIAGQQKNQNRRFLEPIRLFDEWVTNYPIKLRPKLNPRRFRAENPDWWKQADLAGLRAYWGGEIAAHHLTRYLKPATCTLYIEPDQQKKEPTRALAKLAAAHRMRADPEGNIEILDTFWHLPPGPTLTNVVPPILAYADLIATLDPRNLEVAKMIRGQHIENALRKA